MENKTLIKLHTIFWVVLASILLFATYIYNIDAYSAHRYMTVSIRILLNIITFYAFYFFVTPKVFSKKGLLILTAFAIVYLIVFGFVFTFLTYYPFAYIKSPANPFEYTLANGIKDRIFSSVAYISMVSALGTLS
jgi:hypothetical protein